jgi:hypothetical protein
MAINGSKADIICPPGVTTDNNWNNNNPNNNNCCENIEMDYVPSEDELLNALMT